MEKSNLLNKGANHTKLVPYIFFFIIFSFLGWILETLFCYCVLGEFVERGFLHSPICPIYGTGALILTMYLDKTKSKTNYVKLFFLFIIIFSFFEYLVGFTLDALFAARWWDYTNSSYNLNGRITLLNSFLWGIATVLFVRFIYPLLKWFKEKIISKIPPLIQIIISSIIVLGILTDFIISCIQYLK